MSNVIDFAEHLQKRAAIAKPETSVKEPDIDLLYQLLHETSEWFDTDDGENFWCEESFISHAINLCDAMIQMKDKSDDDILFTTLSSYVYRKEQSYAV